MPTAGSEDRTYAKSPASRLQRRAKDKELMKRGAEPRSFVIPQGGLPLADPCLALCHCGRHDHGSLADHVLLPRSVAEFLARSRQLARSVGGGGSNCRDPCGEAELQDHAEAGGLVRARAGGYLAGP